MPLLFHSHSTYYTLCIACPPQLGILGRILLLRSPSFTELLMTCMCLYGDGQHKLITSRDYSETGMLEIDGDRFHLRPVLFFWNERNTVYSEWAKYGAPVSWRLQVRIPFQEAATYFYFYYVFQASFISSRLNWNNLLR